MQCPASSYKGFQAITLGLMVCMLGACDGETGDTMNETTSFAREQPVHNQTLVEAPHCSFHFHECLDANIITARHIKVDGTLLAEEILVEVVVPDYVFTSSYDLKPLEFVEDFINENHHLPGIPSSASVEAAGGKIPIGDSYRGILEKIEELTLYTIEQEKRIAVLEKLLMSQNEIKGSSPGGR